MQEYVKNLSKFFFLQGKNKLNKNVWFNESSVKQQVKPQIFNIPRVSWISNKSANKKFS